MAMRRSSIAVGTVGVLLVVGAAAVKFALVPALSKLPSNTDLTTHYSGKGTLLNTTALKAGDSAHILASNVPITLLRHTKVTKTDGNTAVIADDITLNGAGTTLPNNHVYAVDRKTLDGTTPPKGVTADPAQGLTVAFPLSPKPHNSYHYYDSASRLTVPVTYAGAEKRGGRSVYLYRANAAGPVQAPNLLALLPPSLPKATLVSLAPLLPAQLLAQLAPMLPKLPATVPLAYAVTTAVGVWADKRTGLPLDETIDQQVVVSIAGPGAPVPLIPVLALKAEVTPDSTSYLAHKASTAASALTLISVTGPLVVLIVGVLAIVGAVLLARRRPTKTSPADATEAMSRHGANRTERPAVD